MTNGEVQSYCLEKPGAVKTFPFDDVTAVFKVGNKIFALMREGSEPPSINLKCNPLLSLELRALYASVKPGYHMNKKHWNTVTCNGDADDASIKEWIDHSYALVFASLSKRVQAEIADA